LPERLATASQAERASFSGSGLVLSLVAATVFPFDCVLAGMVAAGQGIEAICLYLGLTRAALDGGLARLGLQTPHERPLRKPGARGWSVLDTIRLIAWRVAGVHPETIGQRLERSPAAVRAKARRLGIPKPQRSALRRLDPATLADPLPGFAAPRPGSAESPLSSTNVCGTAAGFAWSRAERPPDPALALRPVEPCARPRPPAGRAKPRRMPGAAQRELPLFRVVPAGEQRVPASASPNLDRAAPPAVVPASAPAPVDPDPAERAAGDLAWIGRLRKIEANEEAVLILSMRYFGGQHWKKIAEAAGATAGRIRTALTRIWLPRDYDRSKFYNTYSPDQARATVRGCTYELIRDTTSGQFFWRDRKDRRTVTTSRETRRAKGMISEYERYRSQLITLAPRRPREPGWFIPGAPFAGNPAILRA
jgi:hypothetical protein